MRSLPSDLTAKVKQSLQTLGNVGDPKLKIAVSRAKTTVTDANYWTVETIREKAGLGDISVAPRRFLKHYGAPDRLYEIHVEDGQVHTAIRAYPDKLKQGWQPQFTLGPSSLNGGSVAVAFDGYWERHRKLWRLATYEKPWIFWVDSTGILWGQHWDAEDTKIELATGVTRVKAIRAWKNVNISTNDQGIVVGYIKTDGKLYYRNYCQQADYSSVFEMERQLTAFTGVAVNLNLFLTNDYRMGFSVQDNANNIHWFITGRNWAGMAIYIDTLYASPFSASIEYEYVEYIDSIHTESVRGTISEVSAKLLWAVPYNSILSAENLPNESDNWGYSITLEFEHGITTPNANDFSLTDSNSALFQVLGITHVSGNIYTLQTSDFNNAFGNLSINFTGDGITKGENEQAMDSFSFSFLPANLVPTFIPVPEVEVIWNE